MTERGWARFFARIVLGLTFFMAGWFKCFSMGPLVHAREHFAGPYADTWIPHALLIGLGAAIPVVELLAGLALLIGLRTRDSLVVLGGILIVVTYGHLLKDPFFSLQAHIYPRLILLVIVLVLPAVEDRLALDRWLGRGGAKPRV